MKSSSLVLFWLALAAGPASAGPDAGFDLSASAADFDSYFPSYLANGYFSTMTAPRGTEGNLAYMVAFMDYGKDDIARPAAIPGWSEIDYSTGNSAAGHWWMNQVPLNPQLFKDYSQVLNMREATLTTSYRYVDHAKSTRIRVVTFVSEASTHLAATQISLTPDFDGTVQLSFALNLWAPYQPRLPLATLTGDEMQEAVAAHNMTFVAIPPATPDRAAVWYHGDTHVLSAAGDPKELTLWLDGRAEQGLAMAEAAALRLPEGVQPADIALYKSQYRLALNLEVKVRKDRTYTFTKFIAASREGWGGDAKADLDLATAAARSGLRGSSRGASSRLARPMAIGCRDRRRRASANRGAFGSLLSARHLDRGHALADGGLRPDTRLQWARILGQRHVDLPRAAAASARAREISGHVPCAHAPRRTGAGSSKRIQGREISLGSRPGERQRADSCIPPSSSASGKSTSTPTSRSRNGSTGSRPMIAIG